MARSVSDLDVRRMCDLTRMLQTRRPAGSRTEDHFRATWIYTLPDTWQDAEGNIHCEVRQKSGEYSAVLWSCHTDTVHWEEGSQEVAIDGGRLVLASGQASNCLGADDTVGVWLCREMIRANVPGHYVFHFAEEHGGLGSRGIVEAAPDMFKDLSVAIALDRRGTSDIITHQSGERCCSEAFARSLARQLKRGGIKGYRPSRFGVYTDTAEYTGIIRECTNLSVGYGREHSPDEFVNYWHALRLCHALCRFQEYPLVIEREFPVEDHSDSWLDAVWREYESDKALDRAEDYYPWDAADLSEEDRRTIRKLRSL